MDHPDKAEAARPPAELLDELRLRLLRLDQNHPSRPREAAMPGPAADLGEPPDEPSEEGDPEQAGDPEQPGEPEQAGAPEQSDTDPDAGQVTPATGGPGAGGRGADSLTLPGLRSASEAYQPWFMGSDAGVPWFADE
jgi:hypothetical protein